MNSNWPQLKELFHAAVELAPHDREAFLKANCAADDELHCEVSALLSAHEAAGNFIESPALIDIGVVSPTEDPEPVTLIGRRIGSYEIVREIGHGGMGTVFLAVRADDQYRKQVAIKLVNRGMDTDTILRRFMMERQILANLEHPNIAGLLDGGSTTDGLPYFVMEYVEGTPIDEYCNARTFTTTQRLQLFRQICAALQYAHQNLVVHRDIKPSNILVTAQGVPKLLDFGIAKLLSPGWATETGEPTVSMQILMTPAYASPEQFRGLSITTASDVYSLGVVLYELLSGHHPYRSSRVPEEMARLIIREEPEKPSTVGSKHKADSRKKGMANHEQPETENGRQTNPQSGIHNPKSLRGDLDNIVLKALRKEPERRYASVQEFSEDIRRHLQGLPVTATPDTFGYRTGKFIQRNKAGVAAAAIVIITLLAGSVITSWQARVARRERDKAEQRFNQVRKLANKVLFEYHDGIERLPGSTPLRQKMVQDALEYLDNLAAENVSDRSLQSELATAYFKVAEVQGAPYTPNLGNYKGALASHKKALTIREKLNLGPQQNNQVKLDLARSYGAVGELSQVTGNLPDALENYRKAFTILDSPANESGDTRRELSILDVRFAKALAVTGELAKALESFRKGIAIANELTLASPNEPKLKRTLAYAHIFLGDALRDSGDLVAALASHRTAFGLLEPLATATDAQSRRDVNVAYAKIAEELGKSGDKRGALEIEFKVLAIDEGLAKADPSNALARRDLYIDYYKIAFMQEALHDIKAALANQATCIALCEAVVADNPASAESRSDLSVAYFRAGEMFENSDKMNEALENYQKALAIKEAMFKADPTNMETRADISEDYLKVGDASLKLGYSKDALAVFNKALTIGEELVVANPEAVDGRTELARIYESLGAYSLLFASKDRRVADWQEARRRYQQSLDIWNDLQRRGALLSDYANKPNDVKQKIGKCEAALRKLHS